MNPRVFITIGIVLFGGLWAYLSSAPERTAVAAARPSAAPAVVSAETAPSALPTYEQWAAACRRLPSFRSLRGRYPASDVLPLKEFRQFETVLDAFLEVCTTGTLRQDTNWVGETPENNGFFDVRRSYFLKGPGGSNPIKFQPFAQKVSLPEKSEVFFRGDLHGDVKSLLADLAWLNSQGYLKGFQIARTNFYMTFLGDYTDRGVYGTEVLYTILRLKIDNPDRVFMARGNHEDLSLLLRYGFHQEGQAKFGRTFNMAKIARAYDFLPVVIYIESGGNVLQCNHGGMEPGYDPRPLLDADGPSRFHLLGKLRQQEFVAKNPDWMNSFNAASRDLARRAFQDVEMEDATSPTVLGFMWNDFSVLSSEPQFALDPGRAFIFGQESTQYLLRKASTPRRQVQAVFRAHQHAGSLTPVMRRLVASRGVYRHWQAGDSMALLEAAPENLKEHVEHGEVRPIPSGSVWTFNVGADSAYGLGCGFSFDTFGILTTASAFEDWRLRIVNVTP